MRPEEQIVAGEQANKRRAAKERALLTLVIPTRNEVSNIPHLMQELNDALSGVDYRVVFVDDSSDGTPEAIRALSEEDGRILLIHREQNEQGGGLSTAVMRSEEHTSELQSRQYLVCRLLLEKKKAELNAERERR